MAEVQMLFPMEPKEFWQKLNIVVEQVLVEHSSNTALINQSKKEDRLFKANDVCKIFKISKPTL